MTENRTVLGISSSGVVYRLLTNSRRNWCWNKDYKEFCTASIDSWARGHWVRVWSVISCLVTEPSGYDRTLLSPWVYIPLEKDSGNKKGSLLDTNAWTSSSKDISVRIHTEKFQTRCLSVKCTKWSFWSTFGRRISTVLWPCDGDTRGSTP